MYPTLASGATDPGGEWDEPGFAVTGLDRAGLVQVASDYGQNAIVWLGGSGTARLIVTRQGFCGRAQGEFL